MNREREAQLADIEAMLRLAEVEEDEIRQVDALLALGNLYIEIDKFKVREPLNKRLNYPGRSVIPPVKRAPLFWYVGNT